jgi:hypothetical protein
MANPQDRSPLSGDLLAYLPAYWKESAAFQHAGFRSHFLSVAASFFPRSFRSKDGG